MANIFSNMTGFTFPNTVMNGGPLPPTSTSGMQVEFQTPDGMINETSALLDNVDAYSYGPNSNRPSTQTSYINHPHRIQKVIPKIFLPGANGDPGLPDVALEHALHDGDLTFTLRMPKEMIMGPSEFCHARNIPGRALAQLVNLATVNYILYGLQVGRRNPNTRSNRWQEFFLKLTQGKLHFLKDVDSAEDVWNFLQTYLRPFGSMVGSDMQGGQHEGSRGVATYPVDYVASFLIDGKCRKLNNLWRHMNIAAGDDLVLQLRKTTPAQRSLVHVLTSGARSFREERTLANRDWYFLAPAVATPEIYETPFIHIGRSQGMYSAYNAAFGMGRAPWDARASILGVGVQVTFEPSFVTPDAMLYKHRGLGPTPGVPPPPYGAVGPVPAGNARSGSPPPTATTSSEFAPGDSSESRQTKRQRRNKAAGTAARAPTFLLGDTEAAQQPGTEATNAAVGENSERVLAEV